MDVYLCVVVVGREGSGDVVVIRVVWPWPWLVWMYVYVEWWQVVVAGRGKLVNVAGVAASAWLGTLFL